MPRTLTKVYLVWKRGVPLGLLGQVDLLPAIVLCYGTIRHETHWHDTHCSNLGCTPLTLALLRVQDQVHVVGIMQ